MLIITDFLPTYQVLMLLSETAEEALMFSTRLSAIVEISDSVGRDNIIK